jgi:hypothetical protein
MRVIEGGRRQKIYGVWNWMLVKLNQVMPGVGDHYMGRTGIDSQLTDMPIDAGRPDGLEYPVDEYRDFGARGIFDDQVGGMLTRNFVATLPATMASAARAGAARLSEIARQRTRR